jgi:hypothetical protein
MGKHKAAGSSFVLEINGRAILALSAISMQKARELCAQHWLFDELKRHRSGGCPIWDGTSALTLRVAQPREQIALLAARSTEIARGELDDIVFAFLVPLDPALH